MSHKPLPYSPNFPPSQGYAPPTEDAKVSEGYPMSSTTATYDGNPSAPPSHQAGVQYGFHPVVQPGYPHPSHGPGPVVQQPAPIGQPARMGQPGPMVQPGGWMTIPQGLSNCPPGLEYLSMIDKLLIKQKVERLESFVGYETNNKYTVMNRVGQKVYYAVEDNDCCTRNCCGPSRPFDIKVFDNFRNEVIHLFRPLACDTCLCPCWLQTVEVTAPPGRLIGTVEQTWSICEPCFNIKNEAGIVVLQIKGPMCTFSCCGDVEFDVFSKDGKTKVGTIVKQWSGLSREMFTDADYFGIQFPMDLDVKVKATLLGACFLIDFMFFEQTH